MEMSKRFTCEFGPDGVKIDIDIDGQKATFFIDQKLRVIARHDRNGDFIGLDIRPDRSRPKMQQSEAQRKEKHRYYMREYRKRTARAYPKRTA
jgi:hypothetical protein